MSQKFNLRTLEIKSFRGIKNYTINFDSKSLVLVGENGSGKSSIVNAFEYLFTGKVESLSVLVITFLPIFASTNRSSFLSPR